MPNKSDYQKNLSLQSPILLDHEYKKPKVEKMISILKDVGAFSEHGCNLALDIGCSRGFFTESLAPFYDCVLGMDIDSHALSIATNDNKHGNVTFMACDSMQLPLPDNSVNLVICNHVYEHVPCSEKLFSEIYRVLDENGICYLGAASRLTPIEPHYHLLFLSWLPKFMAHQYMRFMKKGDYYYEKLRTYWGIKALVKQFDVLDYTLKVIDQPDKFSAQDLLPEGRLLRNIPFVIWKIFYVFLPSYIFILTKKS